MAIVVNGVHIFSRGANLVPFELLEATVKPEYIKRTIQSVHDGGLNMLRVWGGGIWQDDLFYEECDRKGILIYHDSMFSMRLYPRHCFPPKCDRRNVLPGEQVDAPPSYCTMGFKQ